MQSKYQFQKREQAATEFKHTCWANAISTCTRRALALRKSSEKIKMPTHSNFTQQVIEKTGRQWTGQPVFKKMEDVCNMFQNYKIQCRMTNNQGCTQALKKGRYILSAFSLKGWQWACFRKFFKLNPKGILTKNVLKADYYHKNISSVKDRDFGQAIAIIGLEKDNYGNDVYLIRNSWGVDFADRGYFRAYKDALNFRMMVVEPKYGWERPDQPKYNQYESSVHSQYKSTCFANALSLVITKTMDRIVGRKHPGQEYLTQKFIYENGSDWSKGGHTFDIMKNFCNDEENRKTYPIRCKEVDGKGCIEALQKGRCVLIKWNWPGWGWSCWNKQEWNRYPKRILSDGDFYEHETNEKDGGHAVVAIGIGQKSGKLVLKIQNSWGDKWGDKGCFYARVDALPNVKFMDVFFYESDLTKQDHINYQNYLKGLIKG